MQLQQYSANGLNENEILEVKSSNRKIEPADFYAFGELLAYSYYFGIQDLHKDNLLSTEKGIQVIDVEQAFSDLLLPNHSLLLPLKKSVTWSAGLNIITRSPIEELGSTEAKALVDGFVNITEIFLNQVREIGDVLNALMLTFESQPIRVFFRGTRDYVEHINGVTPISNLFSEEQEQIARKDVPYFFMFLNKSDVYYYTSKSWEFRKVEIPTPFMPFVNYCAMNPHKLMTKAMIEEKWAKGMLYLARKFGSLGSDKLRWKICSIVKTSQNLIFKSPVINMAAKS